MTSLDAPLHTHPASWRPTWLFIALSTHTTTLYHAHNHPRHHTIPRRHVKVKVFGVK